MNAALIITTSNNNKCATGFLIGCNYFCSTKKSSSEQQTIMDNDDDELRDELSLRYIHRYYNARQFLMYANTPLGRVNPGVQQYFRARRQSYTAREYALLDLEDEELDVVGFFYGANWLHLFDVRVRGGNPRELEGILSQYRAGQ